MNIIKLSCPACGEKKETTEDDMRNLYKMTCSSCKRSKRTLVWEHGTYGEIRITPTLPQDTVEHRGN